MVKTIFEQMGGTYEQQGDYLIPCLTIPTEEEKSIGICGQRHLRYLKMHRKKNNGGRAKSLPPLQIGL